MAIFAALKQVSKRNTAKNSKEQHNTGYEPASMAVISIMKGFMHCRHMALATVSPRRNYKTYSAQAPKWICSLVVL